MASLVEPIRRHESRRRQELRELRAENEQLKKLLAEAELDKAMLKYVAEKKW